MKTKSQACCCLMISNGKIVKEIVVCSKLFRGFLYLLKAPVFSALLVCLECAVDSGILCDALNALLCVTANTSVPRAAALIVVH